MYYNNIHVGTCVCYQPLPLFSGLGAANKMEASPTLEEDRLSYCLELHDQPYTNRLDRALLEPRSISAQLEAVEALSLQVQGVLSNQLKHRIERHDIRVEDDEDGFEFTAELVGLSPSRSLSPVLSEPTTTCTVPTLGDILDSKESNPSLPLITDKVITRNRAPLKQTWSLDTWKKFSTPIGGNTRRGSCGPSMADKYRLSFVDISDSSSSEEEYTKRSDSVYPILDPTILRTIDRGPSCESKHGKKCDKPTHEWDKVDTDSESIPGQLQTAGQLADLQYDDEEIGRKHNKSLPSATFILNSISHNTMSQNQNASLLQNYNKRYSRMSENSCLEYDDEDLNYLVPSSNSATNKSASSKSRQSEFISTEDNKDKTSTIVQNKTKCVDHTSFSPLHTMSISQLQNIVQLLEAKLQGT